MILSSFPPYTEVLNIGQVFLNPANRHFKMASIIRNSIARNTRIVAGRSIIAGRVVQPTLLHFARHNSSQTPSATNPPLTSEQIEKKKALKRQDNLQRDWDAEILTYDKLLPITQTPTPVSFSSR